MSVLKTLADGAILRFFGLADSSGTPIDSSNPLPVSLSAGVTLDAGDLEIGAVEIKNGTDDTRAVVAGSDPASNANGLAVRPVGQAALLGAVTETAPATDTASSGLNGRLQRIAQNLTTNTAALVALAAGLGSVIVDADNRTVSTAESGAIFSNEGAVALDVFTLPAAAAGLRYTFIVQDADGIKVLAVGDDTIRIAGSVSGAAGFAQSTTIGSVLTIVAINATEWMAISSSGTWALT